MSEATVIRRVNRVIVSAPGPQGPAGLGVSGTGLLSVTAGVQDTPSTLSARVAADAANLRTQLGLGTAATEDSVDFAAASHTHTLSQITAGGATSGQILQWNGTAWVPVTYSAGVGGGTGSTDNALLRADGTGGSTAQGSGVTLDDSANLSATNWVLGSGVYSGRTYARAGGNGSNVAVLLTATGTGFIAASVPDGTFTGGNNRGNYAVDFQMSRTVPGQVASGDRSAIIGGSQNTASAQFSVCGGIGNTAAGDTAVALGYYNTVTGSFATSVGAGGVSSGGFSSTFGYTAKSDKEAQASLAGGNFGVVGDAQFSTMVARATTTSATPAVLGLGLYSTALITLPANSSGRARVTITARRATAGGESMTWVRDVAWQRGVAASTTTVDVQTVGTDRGYAGGAWGAGPAWAIAITADATNGAMAITATGVAATNIRWVATIQWAEVTYA